MTRGQLSEVGATRVAKNGYHYTKVGDNHPRAKNGWILTHWLTAEKTLGRQLEESESVRFKDPKFKKDPHNPKGIVIIKKRTASLRAQLARLEARRSDIEGEIAYLKKQIGDM